VTAATAGALPAHVNVKGPGSVAAIWWANVACVSDVVLSLRTSVQPAGP
jgi:hypothetical protein